MKRKLDDEEKVIKYSKISYPPVELHDIPNYIMLMIFKFIDDINDYSNVARVCKKWNFICNNKMPGDIELPFLILNKNPNILRTEHFYYFGKHDNGQIISGELGKIIFLNKDKYTGYFILFTNRIIFTEGTVKYHNMNTSFKINTKKKLLFPDLTINLRNGNLGMYVSKNGVRYEGRFTRNNWNFTEGRIFYPNGDIYIGEATKLNSGTPKFFKGKYLHQNGNIYEGKFDETENCESGKPIYHGQGVLKLADGTVYNGYFVNGNLNGYGYKKIYDKNELISQGSILNGLFHGQVDIQSTHKKFRYIGEYGNGKKNGYGILLFNGNVVYRGMWKDGCVVNKNNNI